MPCPPIPQPKSDDIIDEAMISESIIASNGSTDWSSASLLDLSFRRIATIQVFTSKLL
jgi:hypothetical protein